MKSIKNKKTATRIARKRRIRARVAGTTERPRLAVFRSNTRLVAQLINDTTGTTIAAVSSHAHAGKTPRDKAQAAGAALAEAAKKAGVTKAVFDRGGFLYTGTIAAFADAARAAGLQF
jgi:large subunit ribosomal protein L18